jgi:hypothetical protein
MDLRIGEVQEKMPTGRANIRVETDAGVAPLPGVW